jgi:hypothetical protein
MCKPADLIARIAEQVVLQPIAGHALREISGRRSSFVVLVYQRIMLTPGIDQIKQPLEYSG